MWDVIPKVVVQGTVAEKGQAGTNSRCPAYWLPRLTVGLTLDPVRCRCIVAKLRDDIGQLTSSRPI